MAHRCTICNHKKRLEIDRELVTTNNISKIAKEFNVSYPALYSHSQKCLSTQLVKAYEIKQRETDFDLLQRIDSIVGRAEDIFTRNYNAKKDTIALKALGEQRQTIELLAKISFSLHQAKLTEMESLRFQREQAEKQESAEHIRSIFDNVEILTDLEYQVFSDLLRKIGTQKITIDALESVYTSRYKKSESKKNDNATEQEIETMKPIYDIDADVIKNYPKID